MEPVTQSRHNLPTRTISVQQFCMTAKDCLDDSPTRFVQFVLTGIDDGMQYSVDPLLDGIDSYHLNDDIAAIRDYDSVLGIDVDIKPYDDLTVYPVARAFDTLRANVHIRHCFINEGLPMSEPVHHLPNLCIGKWGIHNMIRAVIPGLWTGNKNPMLTPADQATFYEKGLRPAVIELMGARADDWPPTYQSEMHRARGNSGQLSFQTKILSRQYVCQLGNRIRHNLSQEQIHWGESIVFLHEIRGVKNVHPHDPFNEDLATLALEEFMSKASLTLEDCASGHWWIDVGLNIVPPDGYSLAWRTRSHHRIVSKVLNVSAWIAEQITNVTSSKYYRDYTSHLTALSGCRITPGSRAEGPYKVAYLQLYQTDKSFTYHVNGNHHAKYLQGKDLLMKDRALKYCESIYSIYASAANISSHARIEVRVPSVHAAKVLDSLGDADTIREALVLIPNVVWWTLRSYRIQAIQYVLDWQLQAPVKDFIAERSLALSAACIWLANGLHAAPDDRSSSRDIIKCAFPHVRRVGANQDVLAIRASTAADPENELELIEEEEARGAIEQEESDEEELVPREAHVDGDSTVPAHLYGLFFFIPIRVGANHPSPHFSRALGNPVLSPKAFQYIFGCTRGEFCTKIFKSTFLAEPDPVLARNKARKTLRRGAEPNEPVLFDLADKGIALPPDSVESRSDGDSDSDSNLGWPEELPDDIDTALSDIYRQFFVDLLAKAPVQQGSGSHGRRSYVKLSSDELEKVDEETFKSRRLDQIFVTYQWKKANRDDFARATRYLWPARDFKLAGKPQGYLQCTYFTMWVQLLNRVTEDEAGDVRAAMLRRIKRLAWLPDAQADRIWIMKDGRQYTQEGGGLKNRSPRILMLKDGPLYS